MTMYEEKKLAIPGFNLAFKIWHGKAQKPVLCLHGKLDNAASFDLLAPLLSHLQLVAVDYPGTGFSSFYPEGVLPYWKNDAFLMLHLIKSFEWEQFDIVAHSLGGLLAIILAIVQPKLVRKMVFLDILGPTVKFVEQGIAYLREDAQTFLTGNPPQRTVYPDQESAIQVRMKMGNISYQAAKALVQRGTIQINEGWVWTYDRRLHAVNSTIVYEDELRALLKAIESPVCLIRAKQGVPYPAAVFQGRAESIKQLTIHELPGGHHVHMDNPLPVAEIISNFLA
ncbi:MAG: alpha/beta hydrolase [Gammaproteobacteria bacterium]|nr:alpha/beta hydrolase [Gammaproteobacteria bacterium]